MSKSRQALPDSHELTNDMNAESRPVADPQKGSGLVIDQLRQLEYLLAATRWSPCHVPVNFAHL